MINTFERLTEVFGLGDAVKSYEVISNGNINSTYDVTVRSGGEDKRYVFQRINVFVFKNPEKIMVNIDAITTHIAEKLNAAGESRDRVMHFAHTKDGKSYFYYGDEFWRVSEFVPNSVTFNTCDDLDILRSAGRAFGEFQTMLSDFNAATLNETIPNFHNTRSRIETFMKHVEEDPCGRVAEVTDEIERIKRFTPMAVRLNELLDSGELPLRVTHNDTKINNVLFDRTTKEAKTVIDLDTVMPGLVAHDFGDAIRFAANRSAEDEPDLSLVGLDISRFRAFSEGFIPEVANSLTPTEIKTLSLGAFTMTAELVVRFLDDYISGDKYFKTLYDKHNLVRARCQLCLAEDILAHLDEMNAIVSKVSGIKF